MFNMENNTLFDTKQLRFYERIFHDFEFWETEHSLAGCILFAELSAAVLELTDADEFEDERRKLLAISFFNLLIPDELDEARSCPLWEAGIPFWLAPLLGRDND